MSKNTTSGIGCVFFLFVIFAIYYPICLWTDRNLDFYCSQIKGVPVDVPFWMSMVASIFEPIAVLNLIGELVRLVCF
jgi:hypothetical protein